MMISPYFVHFMTIIRCIVFNICLAHNFYFGYLSAHITKLACLVVYVVRHDLLPLAHQLERNT